MINNSKENIEKFDHYLANRDEIKIDIVDLAKALSINNGARIKSNKNIKKLQEIIPNKKHTLFILLDGFGYYKLSRLPETSILKQNCKMKIKTINPTSTAAVLTSIVSASYPSEHGILGWWNYSKKHNLNYYPVLLKERKTDELLQEKGITVDELFNFKPIFKSFNKKVNIYENREIINSEYTNMFSANANKHGYFSVKEAFTSMSSKLADERSETFNYLYIDGLDNMSHIYGVNSKEANSIIEEVEEGIKLLLNQNDDIGIVLTADHGQVDMTSMIYLNQNYDYNKYFYTTPTIDTRMINFFVKEECKEEFEEKFSNEFNENILLLKKEDIEKHQLLGKGKFSKEAKNSVGEYIAIIFNNKFMICDKITLEDKSAMRGNHSGLTKEETTIPLVII